MCCHGAKTTLRPAETTEFSPCMTDTQQGSITWPRTSVHGAMRALPDEVNQCELGRVMPLQLLRQLSHLLQVSKCGSTVYAWSNMVTHHDYIPSPIENCSAHTSCTASSSQPHVWATLILINKGSTQPGSGEETHTDGHYGTTHLLVWIPLLCLILLVLAQPPLRVPIRLAAAILRGPPIGVCICTMLGGSCQRLLHTCRMHSDSLEIIHLDVMHRSTLVQRWRPQVEEGADEVRWSAARLQVVAVATCTQPCTSACYAHKPCW